MTTNEITLGDIARAHHVAPRTVLKWFKEGFPERNLQAIQEEYERVHQEGRPETEVVALRIQKPL